jgi:ribosomal protein S27E
MSRKDFTKLHPKGYNSLVPEMVGVKFGAWTIVSDEITRSPNHPRTVRVKVKCGGCGTRQWITLSSLIDHQSKYCTRCSVKRRPKATIQLFNLSKPKAT